MLFPLGNTNYSPFLTEGCITYAHTVSLIFIVDMSDRCQMKAEMSGFISVPKDTNQNTSLYMRIQCEHKKMLFFEK